MLRVLFDFSVYITIHVPNNSTLQCVYLKKKKKKIPETQLSHTVPVLQYLAGEKTECREVAL